MSLQRIGISNEDLIQVYKKEKNLLRAKRIHVICTIKISECIITKAAERTFQSYQNIKNWLDRFEKYGLDGQEDRLRCGRTPVISCKKMKKSKEYS